MSKKITQKIKKLLTQEDLKVFESAIDAMVTDQVNKQVKEKVGNIATLKEEELKKKYDNIVEKYVIEEVEKRIGDEKAKLIENYDKKLKNLEEKVVAKLDSFLEHVIIEQISDEMLEKIAINETLLPVVNNIKDVFMKNHIELDSQGEKMVKELTESKEKTETELSESIAKNMELEERLEKSAIFLMISEKTAGLKNTDKKRVVEMFKDKKFNEVEKKIDDFVTLIKEGKEKKIKIDEKVEKSKKKNTDNVISENDGLEETKKTVINDEEINEKDELKMSELANNYFNQ